MAEDSSQEPDSILKSGKSINKNASQNRSSPRLPWWVELLFVQLGLPDKWLPRILKTRKSANGFLLNNIHSLYYTFIILLSLIYFHPLVRQAKLNNQCIYVNTIELNDSDNKKNTNYAKSLAKAYQLCNGESN